MTQRLRTCLVLWSPPLGAALYQVGWAPFLMLGILPFLYFRRLWILVILAGSGWLYAGLHAQVSAQKGPWSGVVQKEPSGTSLTVSTPQGRIRTSCQPIWPNPKPGDQVLVYGKPGPVPEKLLATTTRDRVGTFIPNGTCHVHQGATLLSLPLRMRQAFERPILHSMPEPEASFVAGLVLGSRQLLSQNLRDALQTTGTSHLVAVSGANVTLLLGALRLLSPAPPKVRLIVSFVASVFVVLITGASSAVARGACMAWLGVLMWFNHRQVYPSILLGFSALLVTLYNPLIPAHDGSFQFSYAAFASLLLVSPFLQKHVVPRLRWVPELLRNHFLETLAATTGTIPLSYWKFGSVSLLGLMVNPLVLWLVPIVTLGGALLILVGGIPILGTILGLLLIIPTRVMLRTITFFA